MIADLVIHHGRIVHPDTTIDASLAVKEGKILAIGAPESMPTTKETLNATGLHILPGAIDVHVHFRDPGLEYKEDWGSGSRAAARGTEQARLCKSQAG